MSSPSDAIDLDELDSYIPSDLYDHVLDKLAVEASMPVGSAICRFAQAPKLLPHNSSVSFSQTPPTIFTTLQTLEISYSQWLALPIPPTGQLLALCERIQKLKSRYHRTSEPLPCSLEIYSSSGTVYAPIWLLEPWLSLGNLVSHVHSWSTAIQELKCVSQSSSTYSQLAASALARLSALPVDAEVPLLEKFRTCFLPRFLSNSWLSDEHVNAGGRYINAHPECPPTLRTLDSLFLQHLESRFPDHRAPIRRHRPHPIDKLIASQAVHELLLPVYRQLEPHWTLIYINVSAQTYSYADTLCLENISGPSSITRVMNAWLTAVCGVQVSLMVSPRPFPLAEQFDSHSCGVAVLSTMAHYALHGNSNFNAWAQETAYMHRLQWLLRLSEPSMLDKYKATLDPPKSGTAVLNACTTKVAQNVDGPVDFDECEYESEDDSAPVVVTTRGKLSRVSPKFLNQDSA
ncbi:hypothetical protein ACGC1H_002346 [Rhizoctonia solani]